MGITTIEWSHYTFNPWLGCTKVSPGCANCYAETWSKRSGLVKWGNDTERRITSDQYWRQPLKWNKEAQEAGERRRVFCASLADIFEERPELYKPRRRLAKLIWQTESLDWLFLTKRIENAFDMMLDMWFPDGDWPDNYWLGTTVENQETANARIPELLKVPAKVRFLSCEPLLKPIDLMLALRTPILADKSKSMYDHILSPAKYLHWIIGGSESGTQARAYELGSFSSLRDQSRFIGIPFFMKQLTDRNGKKIPFELWPEDLQIRELPTKN